MDRAEPAPRSPLQRLLAPRSVVVVGGDPAEEALRQCRAVGFTGEVWPVHPRRTTMAGVRCLPDLDSLPGVPDAAFVAVDRHQTVQVVAALAALGVGGVVCHAAGFAEAGELGAGLQRQLVAAAGGPDGMALVGPNCLGLVNYLDGVALWCEQHGGDRVDRGVAVLTQSGNLGMNLTMQQRSLPISFLATLGNCAVTGFPELMETLLEDDRVTAIGLHLEDLPDVAALSRVAELALRRRVPVVVLKAGTSELGSQATLGHTRALATPDALCDAVFTRLGMARVHDLQTFVETLKLLHVHGALPGSRITSASCSGGEAAHLADLAATGPVSGEVSLPPLSVEVRHRLGTVLGERVAVGNPLDYHTYIWDDLDALTECFTALLGTNADLHLLLLDLPRADRCDTRSWQVAVDAFSAARDRTGARAAVVSSLPEGLPEPLRRRLLDAGIAPMQGIAECLSAVAAAGRIGAAQAAAPDAEAFVPVGVGGPVDDGSNTVLLDDTVLLDEVAAKSVLAGLEVAVPRGVATTAARAPAEAARLGFPVVLKAVSSSLTHKTEAGAVALGLTSEADVRRAADRMVAPDGAGARTEPRGDRFLVEQMVSGVVAELLVGVTRDPRVGLSMTLGAGGVLTELLDDARTLLLPASSAEILVALQSLRLWPLLTGYRGGAAADVPAVVAAVAAIGAYACREAESLVELEVNPLVATPTGATALDALIRRTAATPPPPATSANRNDRLTS